MQAQSARDYNDDNSSEGHAFADGAGLDDQDLSDIKVEGSKDFGPTIPSPLLSESSFPPPAESVQLPLTSRKATIEEVLDPDADAYYDRTHARYTESFSHASTPISSHRTQTNFKKLRDHFELSNRGTWGPFADGDEWELARWLVDNTGQKS